ncbi:hypothetical protein Hanom_Chr14g01248751 [Helianthus anomalus]
MKTNSKREIGITNKRRNRHLRSEKRLVRCDDVRVCRGFIEDYEDEDEDE